MKHVLVLTGSPRPGGNSTILAQAFAQAVQQSGHTVDLVDAAKSGITGCIACDTCWQKGVACSVDPRFNQVAPLIQQADVLVFAFPLYWYSIPAQIKAVIDKMYSLGSVKSPTSLKNKEYLIIVTGEESDRAAYNGVMQSFASIHEYLNWKQLGSLIAGGLGPVGAAADSPFLEQAKELANTL